MTTIRRTGEFEFIERIKKLLPGSPNVILGAGDDCAVVRAGGAILVVTCDLSIEDVHFRRGVATWADIGWKAVAVSLSDIAAMGCAPRFVTVSLAAPGDTEVSALEELVRGMAEAATAYGAAIIGGDTTESHSGLIVDTMAIGEAVSGRYVARGGAKAGDILAVTGSPGDAAAGLYAQEHHLAAPALLKALHRPIPRIREGQWLARQDAVHAMIDISDGLAQDASHLATASGLQVDITRGGLPVSMNLEEFCAQHELDAPAFALTGGDAYELLFAVAKDEWAETLREFRRNFDTPLTEIGAFTAGNPKVFVEGRIVDRAGYEHFMT